MNKQLSVNGPEIPASPGGPGPLGRETVASTPQCGTQELLETLNADYPQGLWLWHCGNPPPEGLIA